MTHALPPCHKRELAQAAFPGETILPSTAKTNGNAGLVFDRYLRIWYETPDGIALTPGLARSDKNDPGTREDLESFCKAYGAAEPGRQGMGQEGKGLVALTHRRLDAFLKRGDREMGRKRDYETRWRVVTGLGTPHPLENGFVFDRSSGAPYFPGSSVKGLCRAAAEGILGMEPTEIEELFGVEPTVGGKNGPRDGGKAGRLVFLPAFPAKDHWPKLEVDIVNNHHESYYRGLSKADASRATRPCDVRPTDNPVPVFFLTVAAGTPFTFRLCDRNTDGSSSLARVDRGFECLEAGLDILGIGAKTASGYGTFRALVP